MKCCCAKHVRGGICPYCPVHTRDRELDLAFVVLLFFGALGLLAMFLWR